ncbi:MAG: gamma-glutamyl-gamma-aminobutyrate hydrolase family protein [bacterium]|nr:gamma-glutamyl-gamma-aminobutyrate hydrolase family protein [bacterium]
MILVLNGGSPQTKFIADIVDNEMDVRVVPILDATKSDFEGIKGIIISHGSFSVTAMDTSPYLEKVKWAVESGFPILGISLGHQLLGLHFGAQASMMKHDSGWKVVEAFEESILFERLPTEVEMMKNHYETISIPQGFKLIAASDACVNEAMQHESKPYFGVQFQPEVSGNHGAILIENFVFYCLRQYSEM